MLAADGINVDCKLVNSQFNMFKTTSTGVRCICIALFLNQQQDVRSFEYLPGTSVLSILVSAKVQLYPGK